MRIYPSTPGNGDRLYLGAGNDTLTGSAGNDQLFGGTGTDVYSFAGSFGADTISDASYDGTIWFNGLGAITGSVACKTAAASRYRLPPPSNGNWPAIARQAPL